MIGTKLGRHRLVSRIGSGAMGTVYRGEDGDSCAAVKVLHPHLLERETSVERFEREARAGQRIRHPNVVRVLDSGRDEIDGQTLHYLVMEYVEGRTLHELIEEHGSLPDWLLREIGRQTAAGLEAIHGGGILHRDIKPKNLIFTDDETVKIMDLGLARLSDLETLTEHGHFVGSLPYAAPEMIPTSTNRPLDGRVDLFSLGATLYELATGRRAFEGEDNVRLLRAVLHHVPEPARTRNPTTTPFLSAVIDRLLSKARIDRFASASDVSEVLREEEDSEWWRHGRASPHPRPVWRPPIPRETAVQGREPELGRLRDLFGRVDGGEGWVVLVEGEAGMGKTRLLDEMVARLVADGGQPILLSGAFAPGGAATALQAFTGALRDHFEGTDLLGELDRRLEASPSLARPLAAILRNEPAPVDTPPLVRDEIHTALCRLLRSLAADRTTILIVEDLHFAPDEGLAAFASIAMAVPGHRLLLIGTTRRRFAENWQAEIERLDHVVRIGLEPLAEKDVERIVADSLEGQTADAALSQGLARRSGGNPLFVFEILRDLRDRDVLRLDSHGVWRTSGPDEEIPIPETVLNLFEARLEGLEDADLELLEVAACCGVEFDPLLPGDVLDLTPIGLLRALGRVERHHGIVRSRGRRFAFVHDVVRQVLYERQGGALREEYHARIAEALEKRVSGELPGLRGPLAADIAEHHLRSGRPERALAVLEAALDHVKWSHENDRARALLTMALASPEISSGPRRYDLLLRLGDLELLTGRPEPAAGFRAEAMVVADELGDVEKRIQARVRLAPLRAAAGSVDEAETLLDEAVALAREIEARALEAEAMHQQGNLLADRGRLEEARRTIAEACRLAEGDPRISAVTAAGLGQIDYELGRLDAAHEALERSVVAFRELDDRRNEAVMTCMLGLLAADRGRYEEAQDHHRAHLNLARRIGYRRGEEMATSNLGDVLRQLGRYGEARDHFVRAGRLCAEMGDEPGRASALLNRSIVDLRLGRADRARETLDGILAEEPAPRLAGLGHHWLGQVAMESGDVDEALRHLEEALRIDRAIGFSRNATEDLLARGVARLARGDRAEGIADLEKVRDDRIHDRAAVLATCHLVAAGAADPGEARRLLRGEGDELSFHERLEAASLLWRVSGSREDLEGAPELLARMRESVAAEDWTRIRTHVPMVRDVLDAIEEAGVGDPEGRPEREGT